MKNKTVIYARFSSHNQTEQSIEGQLRVCYDYAKQNDLKVVGEYIDRALTGTSDKRPEFLQMIADSKNKNFEYVLVYQLDRFARNRYDSANYKAKLKKNGVRVLSARENITNDASGILVEGILESMAEYYSAELSQKVKRGFRETLIKGHFTGGHTILGYSIVDKKWVIDSVEGPIIEGIFNDYQKGISCKKIVDDLNNRGIRTKTGIKFRIENIRRIIRNVKYTGKLVVNGEEFPNVIPPIVTEELYRECNDMMDKHMYKHRETNAGIVYLLSGKMFCGYCNGSMTAQTGTGRHGEVHRYYKCRGKIGDEKCHKKCIRKYLIEDIVFSSTIKYVLKPNVINEIAKIVTDKFNSELQKAQTITYYERELNVVNKNIENIMVAIREGIFSKTTKDELLALEERKDKLEISIEKEKNKLQKPLDESDVRKFLQYYAHKEYKNNEEKNEFFSSFINRVILYDDKVIIYYNTNKSEIVDISNEVVQKIGDKSMDGKIKKNSSEQGFKRVTLGCGSGT